VLHLVTAVKAKVESAIDNAIGAFAADNAVVREKMNDVLNPANEAERQQLRQQILKALEEAKQKAAADTTASANDFFVSRDLEVGLAQAAMNAAVEQNAASVIPLRAPFQQFGPLDPGWIESLIDGFKTLITGKAPFVQHQGMSDFLVAIPDRCEIALVADWGAHNTAAAEVAAQIRAVNPDVCIHLGDIYYAGQDNEADEFLGLWPLADAATRRIPIRSSFALNGNHEMFSGGRAYFGRVLTAFGQSASYFGLRNAKWQFLAFDSAYVEHRLIGPADAAGLSKADAGVVSQFEWLADKIEGSGGRETVLLSHHQPFSAFQQENSDGRNLKADVQRLFETSGVHRVFGWFFGHEHRCTIYNDTVSGFKARLIGNGCIPHSPPNPSQLPDPGCQAFSLMNTGVNASGDALSGFALLKVDAGQIDIQYINSDGTVFHSEEWRQGGEALTTAV
jgi:hypothetical protein